MSESSIPVSSQPGVHRRLVEVVGRHLTSSWQQPLSAYSRPAFTRVSAWRRGNRPVILDSGCGTGGSTAKLAMSYPECDVIGIDRSAARLKRRPVLPVNAMLVRAELADFWRLAHEAGWPVRQHFLLYPNPWPKAAHLKRRWHAHPVWPSLLALGGRLEMRTNFPIYAEEFAIALALAGFSAGVELLTLMPEQALSAFEFKYIRSGHPLFRVRADLGAESPRC